MQFTKDEVRDFEPVVVPNDFYDAKVIEEKEIDTQYGRSVVISFEILEGPHKGKVLDAIASKKLNKKTKLNTWLTKLGVDTAPLLKGEKASADIVGKICRILTATQEREGIDGKKFQQSRVKDIDKK